MNQLKRFATIAVLVIYFLPACNKHDNTNSGIQEIIKAFDKHQVVALGEIHGWKEESEFIFSLIKYPSFAEKVNDIVVECGNSKYQSIIDDYINGKDVAIDELQMTWRNMTVLCTCDAPIYEQLFQTVRTVNQNLSSDRKIRVLLGEPPINWSEIKSAEQIGLFVFQRDQYYADVVSKEVIDKKRKALLIMGSLHLIRTGWGNAPMSNISLPGKKDTMSSRFFIPVDSTQKSNYDNKNMPEEKKAFNNPMPANEDLNVAQILEAKYAGKLFIILPYDGYVQDSNLMKIEEKFKPGTPPYIISTKNTWIGKQDAGIFFSRKSIMLQDLKPTGEVSFNPYPNNKIADLCDAYLYISDKAVMTRSVPLAILKDSIYLKELNRRSMIVNNQPFRITDYTDTSKMLHSQ
ncbi:MAG: hypothetical protein ABI760_24675 [Ferruginibacter sp.]